MSYALDVNILLYASDTGNHFHQAARTFVESCMTNQTALYLGWPTVMSYLRIATHPAIFDHPLSEKEALANVDALLELPHARVLSEGEGFWDVYRAIAAALPIRGNLVPDAHLAALLRHHGIKTLYTRDKDFLKFSFLNVVDPFA